ncbi:PREDICTED: eukaryotic translation initiation factor 3 subunit C-like, partial [Tauraco erythrolophus]|uniref:eukaryotic translation initiation factor 3 subunit C-like n=1 Tax=Tauraco erythrolophus TaxID=121530 RepID=UPI000523634F
MFSLITSLRFFTISLRFLMTFIISMRFLITSMRFLIISLRFLMTSMRSLPISPTPLTPLPHLHLLQILYNRTMVQLGICAFRQGLIKDAHNALLDIQSSGRAKELLGQGLLLRSLQERNPEQEKVEKRRQVPFHMHVNLELLECVYLVAAMLLEIPYMAAHEFDARRRMISKQFHHQLRVGERQPLLGPPESMREHVVAASKAMKMGDWRTCHRYVVNEKMNGKVWDLFPEADKVRAMLV